MEPDLAWTQFVQVSKILLMVIISTLLITDEKSLHRLAMVVALSLGFYGLKGGFWFCLTGGQHMVYGPEHSFLEANNAIGLALAMNLPWLWYLRRLATNRLLRLLMLAMFLFSYPAVVGTFSRGAWLAASAATLFMILKSRYRIVCFFGFLFLLTIALPMVSLLPERIQARYSDLVHYESDASAQSRLHLWRVARNVALDKPILGAGFDYYSLEIYRQYYPDFLSLFPEKVWKSHSIWFAMLGEHGFTGLILWVLLVASCLLSARKLRAVGARDPDFSSLASYGAMLEVSFMAYIVAGTFLDAAYFDVLYQSVGVIVIIKNWIFIDDRDMEEDGGEGELDVGEASPQA